MIIVNQTALVSGEHFDTVHALALILPPDAQKFLNNLASILLNKSCCIEDETINGGKHQLLNSTKAFKIHRHSNKGH